MSSSTSGLTGSGSVDLGGAFTILEVDLYVTAIGDLVSIDGPATVPRLHRAGWVGLGYADDGVTAYGNVYWSAFIDYPSRTFRIYPLQVFADTMFYDIFPGTTVRIDVFW